MSSPIERALLSAFPWLAVGLLVSPLALFLPAVGPDPSVRLLVHLAVLVAAGLSLADRIARYLFAEGWFAKPGWSARRRVYGTAIVLVIIPTGVIALIALASSAALGFDPSVQYLQLLSALDIVWAGAALLYGSYVLWGRTAARVSAAVLGVACVASLWNYVRVVGFGEQGEWVVDGGQLMRLVIPFDMLAAVAAVTVLVLAVHRLAASHTQPQPIEQASDQS